MERKFYLNTIEASSRVTDPWEEIYTYCGNDPGRPDRFNGRSHPDSKHSAQAYPGRVGGLRAFFASLPKSLLDQMVGKLDRKSDDWERSSELLYSLREGFGERLSARGSRERGRDFGDRERNERIDNPYLH